MRNACGCAAGACRVRCRVASRPRRGTTSGLDRGQPRDVVRRVRSCVAVRVPAGL